MNPIIPISIAVVLMMVVIIVAAHFQTKKNKIKYQEELKTKPKVDPDTIKENEKDKAWKTATLLLYLIGVLSLISVPRYLVVMFGSLYIQIHMVIVVVLGITFIVLGKMAKKRNERVLKIAVAILWIAILEHVFSFIIFRNTLLILMIIVKFVILSFVMAPMDSVQKKILEIKAKQVK